jgi:hypothetical protein
MTMKSENVAEQPAVCFGCYVGCYFQLLAVAGCIWWLNASCCSSTCVARNGYLYKLHTAIHVEKFTQSVLSRMVIFSNVFTAVHVNNALAQKVKTRTRPGCAVTADNSAFCKVKSLLRVAYLSAIFPKIPTAVFSCLRCFAGCTATARLCTGFEHQEQGVDKQTFVWQFCPIWAI